MKARLLCACLFVSGSIAAPALAAPGDALPPAAVSPVAANAALRYWPAFDLLPRAEADVTLIGNWRDAKLDQATAQLLERGRISLTYLHAGAAMSACDWGLESSQGPYMRLPHLVKGRELARLACLRIRYELQQRQDAAAVDDASDVFTCARHLGQDRIMISMLVQYSMEQMAIEALASGLDTLDAPSLARLEERLDRLDQQPAGPTLADAINTESMTGIRWSITQVKAGGANPDWTRIFSFMAPNGVPDGSRTSVEAVIQKAGGTPDAVIASLQELLAYNDEVAGLLKTPLSQADFRQKADAIRARYQANPFARAMLPAYTTVYDALASTKARWTLLKAAIAVVQHGPEAAATFTDPVNRQPLTCTKRPAGGFELSSKVDYRGEPVKLVVGSGK